MTSQRVSRQSSLAVALIWGEKSVRPAARSTASTEGSKGESFSSSPILDGSSYIVLTRDAEGSQRSVVRDDSIGQNKRTKSDVLVGDGAAERERRTETGVSCSSSHDYFGKVSGNRYSRRVADHLIGLYKVKKGSEKISCSLEGFTKGLTTRHFPSGPWAGRYRGTLRFFQVIVRLGTSSASLLILT